MKLHHLALLAATLVACAGTTRPDARPDAVTAKLAIEIEQNTLLAPSFDDQLASELRQAVLDTKNGVPVTDAAASDLVLRVVIQDVNFTHATRWEWQLIDNQNQAIVLAKTDTSSFGKSAEDLAGEIVAELNKLDLNPYASSDAIQVAQPAQPSQNGGLTLTPVPSATNGENAWAIVIGVENYRESLATASGAERDADAFAAFARTTLNVPEANIKVLKGERASRADLQAALMEWLPRNAVQPGGKVYVFFSGHGAPDIEEGSAYLLPYDANPTYVKSGGIRVADLQTELAKLKGQQTYLFLDACFSGSGERSVLAQGTRPLVPVKALTPSQGVVTFSASQASETTGAHAASGHGLFTYHLLNALSGAADANADRNVSLGEIQDHLVRSVQTDARRDNREQTPTVALPAGVDVHTVLVKGL